MKRFFASLYSNTVFANSCLFLIIFAGIASVFFIPREEMPSIISDRVVVSVNYPGANPEEVEDGISRKIEEAVKGMEGIDTFTTMSMENLSSTVIKIKDGIDEFAFLDRVRSRVNEISTFPKDAEKPMIYLPDHSDSVMTIYVSGDLTEKALKEWANRIKDELVALDEVSQVSIFGARDYEINVRIPEKKLRQYGLSLSSVAAIIRNNNVSMSGGLIKTDMEEIRVRTAGSKTTGDALASIPVLARPSGEMITIGQLAAIDDSFIDSDQKLTLDQEPAIVLGIFKTSEEDTIKIADAVNAYIQEKQNSVPPGAEIRVLFDNSNSIRYQVKIMAENGLMGLVIVFIILWVFLNARLSVWTAVGIVFTVFGGLAAMLLLGKTINMVSVFGFIMILGIVADDAIVIGESITWHRKTGEGSIDAIIHAFKEVGLPVVVAVVTTVLAFIPLGFIAGDMGKFIRVLPIVVITCLLISLIESFVVLPTHLSAQHKETRALRVFSPLTGIHGKFGAAIGWIAGRLYAPILKTTISWRYGFLGLVLCLSLITLGVVLGGFLKFDMLPVRDGDYMTANVEFPEGTSSRITSEAINRLENGILDVAKTTKTTSGDPLIRHMLSIYGQAPESEPGGFGASGSHLGGVQVFLLDSQIRGIHTEELIRKWKACVGEIPGATSLSFTGVIMGHDGKSIQIAVDGQDAARVSAAVEDLKKRLDEFDGVFGIQSDNSPGKTEIQFSLRPEARTLGVNVQDLARQLSAGYFGEEVVRVQRGRENLQIKVRYTKEEQNRLDSLNHIRIRTADGYEVPLHSVAEARLVKGPSVIHRTDGFHRVMVMADVDPSIIYASQVTDALSSGYFDTLIANHPGIRIVLEGDAGETATSFDAMVVGFGFVICAIYVLTASFFRSYIQPLIILATIPFGLIGAIWGHVIMKCDLTIISMFGMVGLTGIVVNDAIVLIEKMNQNLRAGMSFSDAIPAAGVRRFRAVVLTSVTTIGGLSPLMFESDAYAITLIPMAVTIVFGVAFTTILTLLLIPCLLAIARDMKQLFKRPEAIFPLPSHDIGEMSRTA